MMEIFYSTIAKKIIEGDHRSPVLITQYSSDCVLSLSLTKWRQSKQHQNFHSVPGGIGGNITDGQ